MFDEEISPQEEVEGFGVRHIDSVGNASGCHTHVSLTAPTGVHHIAIPHALAAVGMIFLRTQQRNIFLATIDMVAPISITPTYSRPPTCKSDYPRRKLFLRNLGLKSMPAA